MGECTSSWFLIFFASKGDDEDGLGDDETSGCSFVFHHSVLNSISIWTMYLLSSRKGSPSVWLYENVAEMCQIKPTVWLC